MCKGFENTFISNHLTNQIVSSSSSAALNFGEALGAESKKDFIHKYRIVLKELRETHINLHLMYEAKLSKNENKLIMLTDECNQLVSIFHSSIKTAKNRG